MAHRMRHPSATINLPLPAHLPPGVHRDPPRRPKPPKPPVPKPQIGLAPIRYIKFYGVDPADSSTYYSFNVLPGETPPTVAGGYAQWQNIPRPLWRSLTVFGGYDPTSLKISVRFMYLVNGSWRDDQDAGHRVEFDIAKLEWMAGMGRESGPPPYVYLSTYGSGGNAIPLIPLQYQEVGNKQVELFPGDPASKIGYTSAPPWVITALEWDENPVRNSLGWRVRQDATVTVQLYEGGTSGAPSVAHRKNPKQKNKAVAFITSTRVNTALAIAGATNTAPDRFALARAIIKFSRNKHLHLRSIRQPIKPGTKIWVPFNY